VLEEFRLFVARWISANLTPLEAETDVTFETWLSTRKGYSAARKAELESVYKELTGWESTHVAIKSFIKREQYTEYKYPRAINARCDEAKVQFGPWIAAIEEQLYKRPEFIKHVPVADRAVKIMEAMGLCSKFFTTDFSSFESSFISEIMEACEFQLYHYMLSQIPGSRDFLSNYYNTLCGENVLKFKSCTAHILGTRMSGEMSTSLGNGFTNLMLLLFAAERQGLKIIPRVEGDDGLCGMEGDRFDPTVFEELGFSVKIQYHDHLSTASFCGMVFDPEDLVNVCDIKKTLANFGWADGQYSLLRNSKKKNLLRAKALSVAHQYPKCPVLQALARTVLRLTSGHDASYILRSKNLDSYTREKFEEVLSKSQQELRASLTADIPIGTRLLVERQYGISVEDQIAIEKRLDALETLGPFSVPELEDRIPPDWVDYSARFVREVDVNRSLSRQFE